MLAFEAAAPPAAPKFDLAVQHQRDGRVELAERLCGEVLADDPSHHAAWFMLAGIDLRAGRVELGVERLERAIELHPHSAAYHSNLGLAWHRLGDLERAQPALMRALQLDPELFEANDNLGRLLAERDELDGALLFLQRAADLKPEAFKTQLALAQTLMRKGQLEPALGHFHCALALNPQSAEACLDLAGLLQQLKRPSGACTFARRALAIEPDLAPAHVRLGSALAEQFSFDAGLENLRRGLELDPSSLEAGDCLGYCLRNLGRVQEAIAVYRRALEAASKQIIPTSAARPSLVHSSLVYMAAFDPDNEAEQILAEARAWEATHARPLYARQKPHPHDRSAERRLRIGYVSPDFREHCQNFFLVPVFTQHQRADFEIVCYSSAAHPDARTRWFETHADLWREVGELSDAALAEQIRADRIDVLVDLTMHMADGRLLAFAERPAPVQISWLAYPGTTGVDAIDYRLTDPHLDPPGEPLPYAEKSLYLPDAFWCYDPLTSEPAVNPLPVLESGQFTFGCLNDFCKVQRGVLELWARVLRAVPDARLLLLAPRGSARRAVLDVFAERGVAEARIEFADRAARGKYLQNYHRIDLALDCLPANGHTTSLDAFWMGVPVITLVGRTVLGRAGVCQARHLGLMDLVAHTSDEFVRIAVEASRDLPRLAQLRLELRARMQASPLMDAPKFTRALEDAYRRAWRAWCGETA